MFIGFILAPADRGMEIKSTHGAHETRCTHLHGPSSMSDAKPRGWHGGQVFGQGQVRTGLGAAYSGGTVMGVMAARGWPRL